MKKREEFRIKGEFRTKQKMMLLFHPTHTLSSAVSFFGFFCQHIAKMIHLRVYFELGLVYGGF